MGQLDRASFGPHLRALRTQAGLPRTIAAKHAGVAAETWYRWETGGIPQIFRAPQIAHALGYSLADLLEPDPERVWVADLTITQDALARVRSLGAPELERLAAQIAEHARAKVAEIAQAQPPAVRKTTVRQGRPVASSVRSRLAAHHAQRRMVEPNDTPGVVALQGVDPASPTDLDAACTANALLHVQATVSG